ncbi:MAG TPA: hypothetical protein VFM91_06645, partial [Propionibacteriaceae bacterium]|nr:hypothetical protein [Propionibacteriaceae bacterium]
VPRRGRCAACKTVFDPDLEQAATSTSWCAAIPPYHPRSVFAGAVPDGRRGRPRMRWPMLE